MAPPIGVPTHPLSYPPPNKYKITNPVPKIDHRVMHNHYLSLAYYVKFGTTPPMLCQTIIIKPLTNPRKIQLRIPASKFTVNIDIPSLMKQASKQLNCAIYQFRTELPPFRPHRVREGSLS